MTVETADLRAALKAVAGHCSTIVDDVVLRRVRLVFDAQNVSVTATNRYSAALALASVWDNHDLDVEHLACDLTPKDVHQILACFEGAAGKDGEVGDTVRLQVDKENLTVTDTGGLFEGKQLVLPRLPMHENYPSIGKLMRVALTREAAGDAPTVWTNPRLLSLFRAAGAAYSSPLILEASGETTTLVVRCGESFLGILMPVRPGEDEAARAAQWRRGWLDRLPGRVVDADVTTAAGWLRDGHGVTVSWGPETTVSIGEVMQDDERRELADAVRQVVTTQFASAAMLKRKLRIKIGDARGLLDRLVDADVVERVTDDEFRVLVAADSLDTCLAELGLSDALTDA
ncbi:MAG: hypothetical protein EOP01_01145 [Propionibacteriaceae bacterium]|nr:MAG: hypothetical protein EOP01_01145 [Propionibacteriaceae bacterium]